MGLILINTMMIMALIFAIYITQADREYFCQNLWNRLWKK